MWPNLSLIGGQPKLRMIDRERDKRSTGDHEQAREVAKKASDGDVGEKGDVTQSGRRL